MEEYKVITAEHHQERKEALPAFLILLDEMKSVTNELIASENPGELLEGIEKLVAASENLTQAFRELARP